MLAHMLRLVPPPPPSGAAPERVAFDRGELSAILTVYGRMVAAGEWRDYAIDMMRDAAVFAIFRRAAERPLFRVEKRPKNAARQGMYAVLGEDGRVLRRGHELRQVLRVFDKALIRAVKD